uniref:Uncharacterized protein n=1 Tax=Oryza punctata TaxID=4537 RepID=A0A0E0JGL2_ORYPU
MGWAVWARKAQVCELDEPNEPFAVVQFQMSRRAPRAGGGTPMAVSALVSEAEKEACVGRCEHPRGGGLGLA